MFLMRRAVERAKKLLASGCIPAPAFHGYASLGTRPMSFHFVICDQGDGWNSYHISVTAEALPSPLVQCVPPRDSEEEVAKEKRTSIAQDMSAAVFKSIIKAYPSKLNAEQEVALDELLSRASGTIKAFLYKRYYETSNREHFYECIKAEIDGHLVSYYNHNEVRD